MLRDKNGDTTTMAKMLGRPPKEIDALLLNAGICSETAKGDITLLKKKWAVFCTTHIDRPSSSIHKGDIRSNVFFVSNGTPKYTTPSKQQKQRLRSIPPLPELPDDIQKQLRKSWDHYEQKKLAQQQQNKNQTNKPSKPQQTENDEKRSQILASIAKYPVLSKLFNQDKQDDVISLKNQKVKEWVNDALPELVQLHEEENGEGIIYNDNKGRDMCLIPVSRCDLERVLA